MPQYMGHCIAWLNTCVFSNVHQFAIVISFKILSCFLIIQHVDSVSLFSYCYDNVLWKSQLRRGLFWLNKDLVHHIREGTVIGAWGNCFYCLPSQKRKSSKLILTLVFSFYEAKNSNKIVSAHNWCVLKLNNLIKIILHSNT